MFSSWLVCLLISRMMQKVPNVLPQHMVEGCIMGQERTHWMLVQIQIFQHFSGLSDKNQWIYEKRIRHVKGTDIYDCVQFGADPNKNPDLGNVNVVSWGDCWPLAEVCTPLSDIEVLKNSRKIIIVEKGLDSVSILSLSPALPALRCLSTAAIGFVTPEDLTLRNCLH